MKRSCSYKIFTTILLFQITLSIIAQDPAFINYTSQDGLISNNVFYTMQDSKGYLWVCTDLGISRFNGSTFRNYGIDEGLDGMEIFFCIEDKYGRIKFIEINNIYHYCYSFINLGR